MLTPAIMPTYAYVLTVLLIHQTVPNLTMQEFDSRSACRAHMHYLEKKLTELHIGVAVLTCSPKGDIQ